MRSNQLKTNKLRIPDHITFLIRKSHPEIKRKIKSGLEHIQKTPEAGKSLKDELKGLRSYRVSRFRIIYRISTRNIIEIVTVGPRKVIYEETFRIIIKRE